LVKKNPPTEKQFRKRVVHRAEADADEEESEEEQEEDAEEAGKENPRGRGSRP
jgi:hypothetical protein